VGHGFGDRELRAAVDELPAQNPSSRWLLVRVARWLDCYLEGAYVRGWILEANLACAGREAARGMRAPGAVDHPCLVRAFARRVEG
jgi:hypothetical protein